MTPKEKAKELVDKMYDSHGQYADIGFYEAVICAHIAVDEIISISDPHKIVFSKQTDSELSEYTEKYYWQQVKQEIEMFNTK